MPGPSGRSRGAPSCSPAPQLVPALPQRGLPERDDLDSPPRGVDRGKELRGSSGQDRLLVSAYRPSGSSPSSAGSVTSSASPTRVRSWVFVVWCPRSTPRGLRCRGAHHPCRQRPCPHSAHRVRLGLPARPECRDDDEAQPGRSRPRGDRSGLAGTAASLWSVSTSRCSQGLEEHRRHRDRRGCPGFIRRASHPPRRPDPRRFFATGQPRCRFMFGATFCG